MESKIQLTNNKERLCNISLAIGLILLFIISTHLLNLDMARFWLRLENFSEVIKLFLNLNFESFIPGIEQLGISVMLGICGIVIGAPVAFILAFLAADNIAFSPLLSFIIKGSVSLIRAIPNLVLMLMIVASLGLGNTAAVVSLTLSSISFLTKTFIGTIEEQDNAIVETLRSTGANWQQIIFHGFLPHVIFSFLVWMTIRIESSVAESISLGVIGVGGIGMLLTRAIRQYDYATTSTLILIIFTGMLILECSLNFVKKKLIA